MDLEIYCVIPRFLRLFLSLWYYIQKMLNMIYFLNVFNFVLWLILWSIFVHFPGVQIDTGGVDIQMHRQVDKLRGIF